MDFTLPALTQESFSRWYNKRIPRTDNIDERVVYPGKKLECSTKSRDLRSQISPENVFVTRETGTNKFFHKVLGNNNTFALLPKRLYSHCFRNINIHSIPADNRILVRLTENTSVNLPYIPDDFVHQKRTKRSSNSRSRGTTRQAKKRKCRQGSPVQYSGWITSVLSPDTDEHAGNGIGSFQLLMHVRKQIRQNDTNIHLCVANPFAGCKTIEEIERKPEKKQALTTIIQFLHHYGRGLL